jgi:hypothetical protein
MSIGGCRVAAYLNHLLQLMRDSQAFFDSVFQSIHISHH